MKCQVEIMQTIAPTAMERKCFFVGECVFQSHNFPSKEWMCLSESECFIQRENICLPEKKMCQACLPDIECVFRRDNVCSGERMCLPERKCVCRDCVISETHIPSVSKSQIELQDVPGNDSSITSHWHDARNYLVSLKLSRMASK